MHFLRIITAPPQTSATIPRLGRCQPSRQGRSRLSGSLQAIGTVPRSLEAAGSDHRMRSPAARPRFDRLRSRSHGIRYPIRGLAAYQILALAVGARAEDLEHVAKLAQFQRGLGLIESYVVSAENHALDLRIIPATPLATGEAGAIGRATCSLGIQRFGGNLLHSWTVRVFLPDEAAPAFACEIRSSPGKRQFLPVRSTRRRGRAATKGQPVQLPSPSSRLRQNHQ